ncbi:MAG: hypothetical protein HQ481_20325 [Alphaproteobacteria bacterium]|nr:hypothetical protein [Alphaproteobacteria bacterium]
MGTVLIAYRNEVDVATFSGGVWSAGLPVGNLAEPQPTRVARTSTTDPAETTTTLDFGSPMPIRFAALIHHNLTQNGIWRVRLGDDAALSAPLYDSGPLAVWPSIVPFGVGLWGEFNWGGKLSSEEAGTYGIAAILVLDTPVRARYLRLDLDDQGNPAGYLQAGRLLAGPAWQPSINLQLGWSIEQVDTSKKARSRGGQTYVDTQPRYRRLRFTIDFLERDEMFGNAYELERLKGVGGDLLVMIDPDDLQHRHRHTVYGQLAESAPIANPVLGRFSKNFVIEEML